MIRTALALMALVACAAPPPFYSDKGDLLYYLDGQGHRHVVRSKRDWAKRRSHILAGMELVMGTLPPRGTQSLAVEKLEEVRTAAYTRIKLTFLAEEGDRVPAYLLVPLNRKGRLPAMLCLHQTTRPGKAEPAGLAGLPNLHYAHELAERGYVALAPDYPSFGDYAYKFDSPKYVSGTMKGIVNHRRAVDLLVSLAEVDPQRIGVIGHSLGGHNSLFVAVFDERIKAVVTSCGFNSFRKYYNGDLTGWTSPRYMPRIAAVYGKDPGKVPFDFTEILGAIAPRPIFINAPTGDSNFEVSGVKDCVAAALPVYTRIFKAPDRLAAVHPGAKHDFPPEVRRQAYAFLDRWLKLH
ncbi:MAG: alpha/beta fold hydrolase [Acidobacteriales bacterium]|nr:alpha/beta fold hydrolase [Terriglobales bacterium]